MLTERIKPTSSEAVTFDWFRKIRLLARLSLKTWITCRKTAIFFWSHHWRSIEDPYYGKALYWFFKKNQV